MDVKGRIRRVDEFQQRRPWLAFPFAVIKKFGDDQAGNLATLIAYYGFFSLFPLLLVFVSGLGLVLQGNSDLRDRIVHSALRDFPVIGDQIARNIHSISGNGIALAIGIALTLWAGLGVTMAAQNAMNKVWDVPRKNWPNFFTSRLRGLLFLAILGSLTVGATFLSGLSASGAWGAVLVVVGIGGALLVNLTLFLLAFRVLTVRNLSWGDVFPGAAVAAVAWTGMQGLGGYYLTHQIKNATEVYGTFAIVIGLLIWLSLGAQITLLAAEINVVRVAHLWPRSLLQQPPLAQADKRTMARGAEVEERIPQEDVTATFEEGGTGPYPPPATGVPEESPRKDGFVRSAVVGAGAVLAVGLAAAARRKRHS